jgi:hypothetical protein
MTPKEKAYLNVKIQSDTTEHSQCVSTREDLKILKAVVRVLIKKASKVVDMNEELEKL